MAILLHIQDPLWPIKAPYCLGKPRHLLMQLSSKWEKRNLFTFNSLVKGLRLNKGCFTKQLVIAIEFSREFFFLAVSQVVLCIVWEWEETRGGEMTFYRLPVKVLIYTGNLYLWMLPHHYLWGSGEKKMAFYFLHLLLLELLHLHLKAIRWAGEGIGKRMAFNSFWDQDSNSLL